MPNDYEYYDRSVNLKKCCTFGDCREPRRTRGLCNTHYARFLRHGDPSIVLGPGRQPIPPVHEDERCEAPGCEDRAKVRQLCSKHYQRLYRHGDVNIVLHAGRHADLHVPHLFCNGLNGEECTNVQQRQGLCRSHMNQMQMCREPGCTNKHKQGAFYCVMHNHVDRCNQFIRGKGWCTRVAKIDGMCQQCYAHRDGIPWWEMEK